MEKFLATLPRSRQPSHPTRSYEPSEIFTKDYVVYQKNKIKPTKNNQILATGTYEILK